MTSSVREQPESGLGFHPAARRVVRFGPFRADLSDQSLWRDGAEVRLPPRALAVLFHLIERPGKVVPKGALLDAVWQDAHVSETSLTEALGLVRQALGDNAQHPEYIQTVHRRGYRFIAPVSVEPAAGMPRAVAEAAAAVPMPPEPAVSETGPAGAGAGRRTHWGWIAIAAAAALAGTAAVVATARHAGSAPAPRVTRATITLPAAEAPSGTLRLHNVLALSPDGNEIVYVGGEGGGTRLYARRMDEFAARPIAGTEGARSAFFSPDGRRIGFFTNTHLKHVAMAGGEPTVVTAIRSGLGASWTSDGTIVFAPDWAGGLMEVDAAGGTPREIIAPPGDGAGYRWPQVLADGDTILATRIMPEPRDSAVVAISRRRGGERVLAVNATYGRYLTSGFLVFARDGALWAASLPDPAGTAGPPRTALDGVTVGYTGAAQYALSESGALIYIPDDPRRDDRSLSHLDRDGVERPSPHAPQPFYGIAACGQQIAATITTRDTWSLWFGQQRGGALTRLPVEGAAADPVWSPGCRDIAYSTGRGVFAAAADGSHAPRRLSDGADWTPLAWTPDGARVLMEHARPDTRFDLWSVAAAGGLPAPLVVTPASEMAAQVSPDGRWLAYQSDESGAFQIVVRPFGRPGAAVQVSTAGGHRPAWSADGALLYYQSREDIMAVPASAQGVDVTALRRTVHRPDLLAFEPLDDGGFLLVTRLREHLPLTTLHLVINWTGEVEQRLAR
jgi:DNA-binding winged helix-turn-helix (wHTH) protein/Tol biopolymer transport system component